MVKTILNDNREEIVKLYNEGVSTCEIGRIFNVSNASVYLFLRDNCGVKIRQTKKIDKFNQVIEMFNTGMSLSEISKTIDIGLTTVHRYCKKAGLDTSKFSKHREDPIINHKDDIIKEYKNGLGCTKLSQKYGCAEGSITKLIKKSGEKSGIHVRDYFFDERFFEKIDTQEKAYIAGFIQGDGYNTGSGLKIAICDEELIYKIRSAMNVTMIPIKTRKPRKPTHKHQFVLKICSTTMSKDLDRLGLIRNKTFCTYLPKEDQIPDCLIRHFLRGLFDADGTITNKQIGYVGYIELMNNIQKYILERLNINSSLFIANSKSENIRKITISKYDSQIKFLDWLYEDATIFLKRKHDRYLQLKQAGRSVCFSNSL